MVNENKIIFDINCDIVYLLGDDSTFAFLTFHSNGFSNWITFIDNVIQTDDENEREWDEDKNDYEPLQDFLMKKIKEKLIILNKFNNLDRLKKLKRILK